MARSFRNMNGMPDLGVRYKCDLSDDALPPESIFAEAGELRPNPAPLYGLELSVMNDTERTEMIPHLTETEGPDQAAAARIWFVREEPAEPIQPGSRAVVRYVPGVEAPLGPRTHRETTVTYKILETPTDDLTNPQRQLMKSTTEIRTAKSAGQRVLENLGEVAASDIEVGDLRVKQGEVRDRNEIFTAVPEDEARQVIDYLTDEAIRQGERQQLTIPADFES
ncbi:MAG TPA: hypothetical protein VGO07_05730 [Candidatus Saccharimonadales bacterium]|nr:hypothetical protein [Candidatus Saccharimonadales bacterium]